MKRLGYILTIFFLLAGLSLVSYVSFRKSGPNKATDFLFNESADPKFASSQENNLSNSSLIVELEASQELAKLVTDSEVREFLHSKNRHIQALSATQLRAYLPAAEKIINNVNRCLNHKDLCGQNFEGESGSFDETWSPAHYAALRALEVMRLAQNNGDEVTGLTAELLNMVSVQNRVIPTVAAALLLSDSDLSSEAFRELQQHSELAPPKARVTIYEMMWETARTGKDSVREKEIKTGLVKNLTDTKDSYSILQFQKRLHRFDWKREELKQVLAVACKRVDDQNGEDPSVRYYKNLQNRAEQTGHRFDVEAICLAQKKPAGFSG